ncbi:flagellar biosynthetic protein FliR [Teichococcus aestuarii]|uniref:flagellar biosynthetic protein FliR n=1 Tax=Teichococcus aestuarii TaxID=568898 RepID=UPI00360D05B0
MWGSVAAAALEVITGAFLGTLSRILLSAVQAAGQIIGQSIGISNAFAFGIGMDNSAVLGAAIYVACLVALFAIDGHHLGLRALADSYALVGLGEPLPSAAAARSVTEGVEAAFRLSMQLSMPFLLLSVLFNMALAGINRALPAMPVFMIGAPALLLVGLQLLQVTAPSFVAEVLAAYGPAIMAGR